MSLDVSRLEKVRESAGGIVQAQCPACAEDGRDHRGEHLRIYPDGRFGCCVHPKDSEHRKRIFALVGVRSKSPFQSPGTFAVRLKTPHTLTTAQSVKAALITFSFGTLGTPETESENGVLAVLRSQTDNFRTPRTGQTNPRAYARENIQEKLKDLETPVLAVLSQKEGRMPHLLTDGTLVIPFDSPARYHWWNGGQSVKQTREEVSKAKIVNGG